MTDKDEMKRQTDAIVGVWDDYRDEDYRRDQSHWRGHGRWADEKKWAAIGEKSLRRLSNLVNYLGLGSEYWCEPKTFLEWGPGGGANLFAMRRFSATYYGVDISKKNLDEASRMIDAEGFNGFRPILLEDDISVVQLSIEEPPDLFLSTAVFQHFPSKAYGAEVLSTIASVVKIRAIGSIQIRYDNGNERFKPISSVEDYERKHITANSYALDEFYQLCNSVGFDVVFVSDIVPSVNYATFFLRRIR